MSNVVDLDAHRPHSVSSDQCGSCGHVWVGVGPANGARFGLECPRCSVRAGVVRFFYRVDTRDHATAPAVLDGLGRPSYE